MKTSNRLWTMTAMLLLAVHLCLSVAQAQIAYDNSAKVSSLANVDNLSTASFAVAGANRVIVVGVLTGAGTPLTPSAVKWGGSGGVSLTQHGSTLDLGANVKLSLWRLIAPTVQTSTVYVSWAATQDEIGVVTASYTGVDQSTPLRTLATNTGSGVSTLSVSATSVADDLVLALFGWLDSGNNGFTATVGGTQTSRQEIEGASLGFEGLLLSDLPAVGTSTSMSYDVDTAPNPDGGLAILAAALVPASAAASGLLLRRRRAANYDHFQIEIPARRAAGL
jgi:hypothetical protein